MVKVLLCHVSGVCEVSTAFLGQDSWFLVHDMNFETPQLETSEAQHSMCYTSRVDL